MVTFEDDVVRMEEFKNRIKRTLIIDCIRYPAPTVINTNTLNSLFYNIDLEHGNAQY